MKISYEVNFIHSSPNQKLLELVMSADDLEEKVKVTNCQIIDIVEQTISSVYDKNGPYLIKCCVHEGIQESIPLAKIITLDLTKNALHKRSDFWDYSLHSNGHYFAGEIQLIQHAQ